MLTRSMDALFSDPSNQPHVDEVDVLAYQLRAAQSRIKALETQLRSQEVSDLKRFETFDENLKEKEYKTLLASVIEVSKYPMFVMDENDALIVTNPAFREYFSIPDTDPSTDPQCLDSFPMEMHERLTKARRALESGAPSCEFEWHRLNADGGEYLRCSLSPLRDESGALYAMSGILDDISVIKRSQERFAMSEARFRNLVENTDNLVLRLDGNLNVSFANPTAREMMNLSSETPTEVYLPDLVHAKDSIQMERKIQECVAAGRFQLTLENRLPLGPEDGHYLIWSMNFCYDGEGNLLHINVIARDITERRDYECQMKRAVEIAEAADRSKSEFLAMISHEIRTPLNSIIGLSDLIESSQLGAEESQMVETINSSGRSLLSLINDVLDLSKVESGHMTLDKAEMDLRECLDQVGQLFLFRTKSKGILFEWSVHPDVPVRLLCDRERVVQVLSNLIGNAIKFTDNGHVKVRASCELLTNVEELDLWSNSDQHHYRPFRITIEVEDSGIGISQEQRVLLFQPFSQADASIRRRFGGTGLGLVISRKLAHLMGGNIDLRSELGRGSTFVFTMNVDARRESSLKDVQLQPENGQSEKMYDKRLSTSYPMRILVVDDVSHNRLLMKTLLKRMGYDPEMASSGEEALELLDAGFFDLVFMDMLMPGLNGIDTTREIRIRQSAGNLNPEFIHIVALTANAMEQDRLECDKAGMDAFISKPIRFAEIQKSIVQAYEAKQANGSTGSP